MSHAELMADGGSSRFRFRSIGVQQLKAFERMMNKDATTFLEIKRTTRARLAKQETLSLSNQEMPYSLLPGSLHSFTVKVDHDGNYKLKRIVPRNLEAYAHAPTQLGSNEYTEPSKLLSESELRELFESIRLLQDYLKELATRARLIDLTERVHAMIPASLMESLRAVEDVFSESTEAALDGMKRSIKDLKAFLDLRKTHLISSLNQIIATMEGRPAENTERASVSIIVEEASFPLPYYRQEEWAPGNYSTHYKRFLNGKTPTAYNREFINELLQNLVIDALIHNRENWVLNKTIDDQDEEVKPLSFRLSRDLSELREQYVPVSKKLEPVQIALTELRQKGIDDGDALTTALTRCEEIGKFLENIQQSDLLSFVKESPGQLVNQIQEMVTTFNLHGIMEQELKRDFPGIYGTLESETGPKRADELDRIYQQLTKVRSTIEKIDRQIRDARDLIAQKATLRDVGTIRENASKEIQDFRSDMHGFRTNCDDAVDLLDKIKELDKEVIDWFDELKGNLSGSSDKDALLWIGLGQAGGQILRECLTYCLQNLADARCSALLTALGITSDDKKKILRSMKAVHSTKVEMKEEAETELLGIFDKKAHILAINLGEEIDKLAESTQPSYFLWGDKHKADASSQTVRTRRNILKLIESGAGAGGATGIGRAYGFRFHSDISEAMRDVGKKGNRSPQHIVISHSLAGGSGSGMVLPVLEQARRTFGEKPVIWVISVGEGSSEKKQTAKINTPFILSDILQAAYEGIHQIYDPVTLGDVRQFERTINDNIESMEGSARSLLQFLNIEEGEDGSLFKPLQILAGKRSMRSSETIQHIQESMMFLKTMHGEQGNNGIRPFSDAWFSSSSDIANTYSVMKKFTQLKGMLPDSSESATMFSEWCEELASDGTRPAVEFWRHWRTCLPDPLSMHLRGRDKSSQTKNDDGESPTQTFFEPDLTGDQLRQVVRSLYHEFQIKKNTKDVPYVEVKQGLSSFYELLETHLTPNDTNRKESLEELEAIINEYARELDAFNNAVYRFDRHIHSLGGAGDDDGIKSVIVSNRHLEKGVEQAGGIKVSSEAYTIFNSVIFDLMLNIIGPRLPSEPGVYITTDAEKFDHKDMLGSTQPPMVVGLLNQRDSASLAEPISVGGTEARLQYPQGFEDLLNTMLSSTHFDSKGTVANPVFVEQNQPDLKFQNMFTALFGTRFRYLLEINPFTGLDLSGVDAEAIDKSLNNLVSVWDESDHVIFDLDKEQRDTMSENNGINGHHIANLIRWYGLIPGQQFARFISQKRGEAGMLDKLARTGSIWDSMTHLPRRFDVGMLARASTLQYYSKHGTLPNTDILYELFPKMGILNAEFLRAVGPAYINSFLPLVMIDSEKVDEFLSGQTFKNPNKEEFSSPEEYKDFVSDFWGAIKDQHTYRLDGEIDIEDDDADMFFEYEKEINHFLDSVDLRLDMHRVGDEVHFQLKLHPRVERYLSVIRDIPAETNHKYLPARSTPATLARYLYSDNSTSLLDMTSNMKKRTGIASPNFTKGLDLLKQLRFSNLLPDETRLSLPTLVRVLLLTPDASETVLAKLSSQLQSSGIPHQEIAPFVRTVLDDIPYASMKSYDVPEQYCDFINTLVLRLHAIKPLISYFMENRPTKWTGNDDAGLMYLESTIFTNDEIMYEDAEAVNAVLGQDTESIPNLKDWFQVIINDVVKELKADTNEENDIEEDFEGRVSVSNENPTILKIKQFFYDLVATTSEAFYQAEYFKNEGKDSRNVHFEMTGFSDRLLGQPSGLLLMMHDRNVNLPMNIIKQNARSSLEHFMSDFSNPKEFSTASDFGPSSFLTMVFTMAPAADLADQFQELMINPQNGLGGQNPDLPIKASKLHPYMLLYNILWLSKSVVGKWSLRNNKVYSRRFQIPVSVIEHHYQSPNKMFEDARVMQQNASDFPGEITMPPSDSRAYARALKSKINGPPLRNIVRLIGIMALRYEHISATEGEPHLWEGILSESEYADLTNRIPESEIAVDSDHLMAPGQSTNKPAAKSSLSGKWGKKKKSGSIQNQTRDTAEDRAKAWFNAYKAWIRYEPTEDEVEETSSEANLFTVSSEPPTPLVPVATSQPSMPSEPDVSAENNEESTTHTAQDDDLDFS